ncbi:MAG: decaprenyl-phosphate phosphoribosyltransferase [Bacteroidia bacterium]|nr:decaprenyl-phosphate phosphoribosyltransferase [Bacteroidia bacterium]
MMEYLKLLRIHQYVKNGFILLPMFFALRITETELLWKTLLVAAGFSLVASSIYILNDLFDVKEDRAHPTKKSRPIASGAISPRNASLLMGLIAAAGLAIIFAISQASFYLTLLYLANNLLYSLKLKHIPILDVCMISLGFVLRLFVGAKVATDLPLSMWIILMTYLLALFLGMAKRRDDVLLANEGAKVRKNIDGYNLEFINGAMMIMASVTIVSYISYTISPGITEKFGSNNLYLTVFFVILGILRYMQLTFVEQKSGSPTKILLKDLFLQLTLAGWVIAFILLLYVGKS